MVNVFEGLLAAAVGFVAVGVALAPVVCAAFCFAVLPLGANAPSSKTAASINQQVPSRHVRISSSRLSARILCCGRTPKPQAIVRVPPDAGKQYWEHEVEADCGRSRAGHERVAGITIVPVGDRRLNCREAINER